MAKKPRRPGFLWAMVVCLVIAALAFSGLILRGDFVGRMIFGVVWSVLGLVWLGSYFGAFLGRSGVPHSSDGPS